MTEKNYNPEQKQTKMKDKMQKVDKNISKKHEEKIESQKQEEKKETHEIKDEVKQENKQETKKPEIKKVKKDRAMVQGLNIPVSSNQAFAINRFIKYKEIGQAIRELEEILLHKRALPMKGEIPHRRGKGMMSGRYPKNAIEAFIKLLKSLSANANANELSNPIISEAYASFASRPFGKFGRVRKKRTNTMIVATEKKIGVKK